ncbi:MAG TPA: glycosyltransferase [Alcanivorax sp.]|nr:glycosyltransferase [Alcanivorax sp.]
MTQTDPKELLVISHDYRSINIDEALESLQRHCQSDLALLTRQQVKWLPLALLRLRAHRYSKVLIDLPFKHIYGKAWLLKHIKNLHIYEEDACQDNIESSKWKGAFSSFYQSVKPRRVIVTGGITSASVRRAGVDTAFVPKGYSSRKAGFLDIDRDIDVAFIGRFSSGAYRARAEILNEAREKIGCQALRTQTDAEYKHTLNRISFFFSADIGLNEYMAKNFEAMACGCILVAFRQGRGEEEALGLRDMQNCILYKSVEEAAKKISEVKSNPRNMHRIQRNSLKTALNFSHEKMGLKIAKLL